MEPALSAPVKNGTAEINVLHTHNYLSDRGLNTIYRLMTVAELMFPTMMIIDADRFALLCQVAPVGQVLYRRRDVRVPSSSGRNSARLYRLARFALLLAGRHPTAPPTPSKSAFSLGELHDHGEGLSLPRLCEHGSIVVTRQ